MRTALIHYRYLFCRRAMATSSSRSTKTASLRSSVCASWTGRGPWTSSSSQGTSTCARFAPTVARRCSRSPSNATTMGTCDRPWMSPSRTASRRRCSCGERRCRWSLPKTPTAVTTAVTAVTAATVTAGRARPTPCTGTLCTRDMFTLCRMGDIYRSCLTTAHQLFSLL
jgi:hypothetical protein